MTLADVFWDVPVASPVAIVDTELKGNQLQAGKDEVDNIIRPDKTATVEEPHSKLRYMHI